MEAACLVRSLGLPQGEEALKARLRRPGHPRLREALAAYLKRLQAPEEAFRALERLEVGAVVTGQQAGLLGGPALTFYKAHTALCLADRAGAAGVFWVASQDHDVEEVRHLHLLRDEVPETLSLDLPLCPRAGSPWPLTASASAPSWGLGPRTTAWATPWRRRRFPSSSPASSSPFSGSGGLCPLTPWRRSSPPLPRGPGAGAFRPLGERRGHQPGGGKDPGPWGKPPLRRKPGATNLFLETDQRRLLFYEGGAFTDGVRRYTAKELWEIARADPSRLTPAAGLRPVFQDLVLPTAGFVVGPNELRYVAELSGVYARYGLAMPALFLRAFGVVVEPPVRRILEKYRLDPWAFVDEGRRPSSGRRRPGWPLFAPSGTGWRGFCRRPPGLWRRRRPWSPTSSGPSGVSGPGLGGGGAA